MGRLRGQDCEAGQEEHILPQAEHVLEHHKDEVWHVQVLPLPPMYILEEDLSLLPP